MKFYKQPVGYTAFLDVLNIIFTVFFTMEFIFKLGAFRFKVSKVDVAGVKRFRQNLANYELRNFVNAHFRFLQKLNLEKDFVVLRYFL